MPSVNSAIKRGPQRNPFSPYQIPRSRSLVSSSDPRPTSHPQHSSRTALSRHSSVSQVSIPSSSTHLSYARNSCLDSPRCGEKPRKVRKLRQSPPTPVEPSAPKAPYFPHASSRVGKSDSPQEPLPPIQYIAPDKPLLASANEVYAKDLVAQSVAMIQEIWLLPSDPPLPPGVHLQGHGPPPPPAPPPHHYPPEPVVVHHNPAFEVQHIVTPPSLPTPSPADSTSDTPIEDADEMSNASTSPTIVDPPELHVTHPIHHHPAPYAPQVTMGPTQQASTFANNLLYFIHEVVRRSRTTCTTLEVAMCYIAAVRQNVRQVLADRENVCKQARALRCHPCQIDIHRVYNSPLHDARRTFLASLVLASKFQQDRAYSNKAWAKLSGLPAPEVTRCETALGSALQWRLWVGRHVQIAPGPVNTSPTTLLQPAPIVTPVPGIVSSGRCLSPPTCNISVDMLEAELFQEELQVGGVHSAHGPNGIPGEGDVMAERLIAAAREESHGRVTGYCHEPIRRHATEPSLHVSSVSLCEAVTRSQSLHPEQYNTFLPVFERIPTLPEAYAGSCQNMEYGVSWSPLAERSLAGSPTVMPSLDDWLIDDPDAEVERDSRDSCHLETDRRDSGMTLCADSDVDMQSTLGGTEASSTAASTPVGSPVISLKSKVSVDLEMPPTPRLSEAYLPMSSVVGAFRVPRTPIPQVVAPAFGQETAWFPPPHFLNKLAAYTPPTEYRLLPQVTPSSQSASSKAKTPLALHGSAEPSVGIPEGVAFSIDSSSPFHYGPSPQYAVTAG